MSAAPPPQAPQSFARAYAGLVDLVAAAGGAGPAPGAAAWVDGSCGGALGLARAAVLAMRHEIATARLEGAGGPPPGEDPELRALAAVERELWPPEDGAGGPARVELPPALRASLGPEAIGARLPSGVEVIASRGPDGGMMISASHSERFPTIPELLAARNAPGRGAPELWARIPPDGGESGRGAAEGPPYVVRIYERPPA